MTSDAITRLIELSRRVATQAGADLYNKPIGSIIGEDADRKPGIPAAPAAPATSSMPKNASGRTTGGPAKVGGPSGSVQKRPVTIERLRSLQRQLRIAMKADNTAGVRAARKAYSEALTEFTKTRSPEEVASLLTGQG